MAEGVAKRQSPFAQGAIEPLRLRSVAFEAAAPAARFVLRGGDAAAAKAGATLGLELPREACRANATLAHAALWLGPDEWLLIATEDGAAAAPAGGPAEALGAALSGVAHSLVDVGHRQTSLILTGREAATALNGACPLDLSLAAFPSGMCTRTLFGKAEIVLWRTSPERFHIEVWRSFTAYVAGLLALTSRDAASLARGR